MKKRFPLTPLQWVFEAISIVLLIFPFVFLLVVWHKLPTQIPTHYNAVGAADAWGGKGRAWFSPCAGAGLYALITILSLFPAIWNVPVKITEENREGVYRAMRWLIIFIKLCMQVIFLYLTLSVVKVDLGAWFLPVGVGTMLGGVAGITVYTIKKYRKRNADD